NSSGRTNRSLVASSDGIGSDVVTPTVGADERVGSGERDGDGLTFVDSTQPTRSTPTRATHRKRRRPARATAVMRSFLSRAMLRASELSDPNDYQLELRPRHCRVA